ncbi:hypothetical protein ED733_002138 [Metarhizium rileyi]|uniref:Uncharacterized protein n=1 Tax=Metarhizium rileyi (strain RCEF 4871) TaxID=1649241 RepID=A0A5C6G653_METRR|nr:hypothetical protein ED733_002138 [Metarhizium rileyi]
MSQVKNLRAMFENKGETSPPDRGRSPGITPGRYIEDAASNGSPRPLSKVRTNFVAIEKDGRMGLRRDHSGESSLSRRRMSNDTADTESNGVLLEKLNTGFPDDFGNTSRHNVANDTIPESPRAILNNQQDGDQIGASSQLNKTSMEVRNSSGSPLLLLGGQTGTDLAGELRSKSAQAANRSFGAKPTGTPTVQAKVTTTGSKKLMSSTSAARAESKVTTRGPQITNSSDKTQRASTQTTSHMNARKVPSRALSKVGPLKTKSQNDTGFTKPKPKSPTKPVQLPSSLTAPTASSVSKVHGPRRSISRQSGYQNHSNQSTIRMNLPNSTASQPASKGQGSSLSMPRPSLGPPPSKQSHVTASHRKQNNVDEGFLARVMRPTQSSSSKATDKAPVTPPRKTVRKPMGGEHGDQVLPTSASSRGFHSKGPMGPASGISTSAQNADPIIEADRSEVVDSKKLSDSQKDSGRDLSEAVLDNRSPANPPPPLLVEQKGLTTPQGLETLEPLAISETCELDSAMNQTIHQEGPDGSMDSLLMGPTALSVELTGVAPASVDSTETAGQGKQHVVAREVENVVPEPTIDKKNCKISPVSETEATRLGSILDVSVEKESATTQGCQSSSLVEVDIAEDHTFETPISQSKDKHTDEQSCQPMTHSTQNDQVLEMNSSSPLENNHADLRADQSETESTGPGHVETMDIAP